MNGNYAAIGIVVSVWLWAAQNAVDGNLSEYAPEDIEANYDKYILERCERLPDKVRYRITNSHMEIDTLCKYLRSLDLSSLREVHLLHLSDATSHEGHFINKVTRAVPPGVRVTACPK